MTQKKLKRPKERLLYQICKHLTEPSFIGGWYIGLYEKTDKTVGGMVMCATPDNSFTLMLLFAASTEPVIKAAIIEAAETIKREEAAQ